MQDTVSGGIFISGNSRELFGEGERESLELIDEVFQMSRKNILDIIFLTEREENQLRETQEIGQGLPEAMIDAFIERKGSAIDSCVIIFSELCDRLIREAQDNEQELDVISRDIAQKQKDLRDISFKARMAISQLGLLEMQ